MNDQPHTADCLAALEAAEAAQSAYDLAYPQHCRDCLGAGGVWQDVDGALALQFEACASCWAAGHCPRCGSTTMRTEPAAICAACRWQMSAGGRPARPACCCAEFEQGTDEEADRLAAMPWPAPEDADWIGTSS